MTVESSVMKVNYAGNGVTFSFDIPFPFLDPTHVRVQVLSGSSLQELVYGTDYEVIAENVNIFGAPEAGSVVTVYRRVPLTQETDYPPGGNFPAAAHEAALDKLTMIVQQLADDVSRSIRVSISDNLDPDDLVLPAAEFRTARLISFDSGGAAIMVGTGILGESPVSDFGQSLVLAEDSEAARLLLGLDPRVGLSTVGNYLDLDINKLTDEGTVDSTNDRLAFYDASAGAVRKTAPSNVAGDAGVPEGYIYGFAVTNTEGFVATRMDIGPGTMRNAANTASVTLSATISKRINANWAEGDGAGGLDTGTVAADREYYFHVITKDAGGTVDVLISQSATSPTVPSGWTRQRWVARRLVNSSETFRAFFLLNGICLLTTPFELFDVADVTTSRATKAALLRSAAIIVNSRVWQSGGANRALYASSPDAADVAPSTTDAPGASAWYSAGVNSGSFHQLLQFTDASGNLAVRASGATTTVCFNLVGWLDLAEGLT